MPGLPKDLWSLVFGRPEIDPNDLAVAVQDQAARPGLNYRTRLLIRDSIDALSNHWRPDRVKQWVAVSAIKDQIETICREEFERPGFRLIGQRLMEKNDPDIVKALLRELGSRVHQQVRLNIGGSVGLLLHGHDVRHAAGIDAVDEVPAEIRTQDTFLQELQKRYGLHLTQFESRHLPKGWENRLHYHDTYGDMRVYLVDVYDMFLGKLFSRRTKDLDDLRMLGPQLDKEILVQRLKDTTAALQKDATLLPLAQQSWYIVFGEALPQ